MAAVAESEAYSPLLDVMKSMFEEPKYYDLEIECNGRCWRVHKDVLCKQVSFFAKCCDGDWKESKENVVPLPDDRPTVVHAMLRYLYTVDYSDETETDDEYVSTSLNVHVHTIADKYDISGLAKLAKSRFSKRAEEVWNTAGFAEAAELVFTDAAVPDYFRETVLSIANEHVRDLHQDRGACFREAAGKVPALGAALWTKLFEAKDKPKNKDKPKEKQYRCPWHNIHGCKTITPASLLEGKTSHQCEGCFRSCLVSFYRQNEVGSAQ